MLEAHATTFVRRPRAGLGTCAPNKSGPITNFSRRIDFYKAAFDAAVLWHLDGGAPVVAGLMVDGAKFFLAQESPPRGTRSPSSLGFTTVRIELFVNDPVTMHKKALAAGATEHSPVEEHQHTTHTTIGPQPIRRVLQGAVVRKPVSCPVPKSTRRLPR